MKKTILLIEDEKLMRISLEDSMRAAGYEVLSCETGEEAYEKIAAFTFDLAVTDVRLPDATGLDILQQVVKTRDVPVVVMTAYGTIKDAVEAIKLGAFDYITKPFALDEFLLLLERALEVRQLKEENVRLRRDLNKCYGFPNIMGESDAMKRVFTLIERVAASDSTILVLGESGTGKELIATTTHYQSRRKDRPLIRVNCAALPDGLIESELFGHEKGAFTGALKRRPGRFELADTGTIFLDEIGDLPHPTQAKILRVIQERTFERVGGTDTLAVDVRIIAATNKNLEDEVKAGRFREDLYYRLNVIPVALPPLRERKEDIPSLVRLFLGRHNSKLGRNARFSKEASELLFDHDYPGNVRELENLIERAVTLSASDVIERTDLPPHLQGNAKPRTRPSLSDVAAEAERDYISRILRSTQGNKTRAAELLGISRKTLWEKINAYRIDS